jgi:hypothetical protein
MLAFPGTAHNSAESWNRNRIDWLVLPTNRFSEIADLLDQIDAEVVSTTADGAYDGEVAYDAVAERNRARRSSFHRGRRRSQVKRR